jgi:hypothetical protein
MEDTLYIKVKCSVCLNGKRVIFSRCLYCDDGRNQVIEASMGEIQKILNAKLSEEEKKQLAAELLGK